MTLDRVVRRAAAFCGMVLGALTASPVMSPATAAGVSDTAHGLIVRLHAEAQAPGTHGEGAPSARRWARVIEEAGVAAQQGRRVGLAARRLDFGAPLHGKRAEAIAARLRAHPDVAWVVPNTRETRQSLAFSEPLYAGQWWLQTHAGSNANTLADRRRGVPGFASAWSVSTGSPAARIAVLDTGSTVHPDLAGRWLGGHDFVSTLEYAGDGDGRDSDPSDAGDGVEAAERDANPALFAGCASEASTWHGTRIAGIVGATVGNGEGGAGVHGAARIVPVRVAAKCGALLDDIIDGLRWAAGLAVDGAPPNPHPARVINISFGSASPCNVAYQEAIDEVRAAGAVVIAAAGNRNGTVSRPASCERVIGVAALNRDGFKSTYSSFGPAVRIATVGGDPADLGDWGPSLGDDGLLTTDNAGLYRPATGVYAPVAGTSFAAPVVAGLAALMLSVNPALDVAQLEEGLVRSARPHVVAPRIGACGDSNNGRCLCTSNTCGAGIVDAVQALAYAADPANYVAPARAPEVIDNADVDAAVALGLDRPAQVSPTRAVADGGGGAIGAAWLLWLAAAVAALNRASNLRPGRSSHTGGSRRAAPRP